MRSSIRPAYDLWPVYNQVVRTTVASLTAEQLAIVPASGRWPLWATVGHLACQRVFGFCDLAGEPGAETTPFPNAAYNCPGDDDLEHVLGAEELANALDSTFRIVERVLDTWTIDMLPEVIVRRWADGERRQPRGRILQRAFAHDIAHIAEINEILTGNGISAADLWA